MIKREQAFQSYFNKWVKNVYKQTACFELKVAKKDILPFSDVQPHQILALENVRNGIFVYKISDFGMVQQPFDSFCLVRQLAWLVIKYEKFFCLISINAFLNEKGRSKRKSLTAERAKEISTISVKL